ncbi:acyltransferase family protein [Kribbella sp. NPDC049174]|uniref:acyltransferase family protein n=1 Tax=Kribbella sp. NPDC049174 TaxID=3364112 RepID=UPI00371BA287
MRVLLTVLVVLHHIAVTYSGIGLWYYTEEPTSGAVELGLTVFLLVNQAWFMGAFFLLSGYFTPASYDRKGPRAFLRDRLIRLGIPLLVFYFVFNPILAHTIGSGPLWFVFALLVFDGSYAVLRQLSLNRRLRPAKPLTYRKVFGFVLALALATYLLRIVVPMGTWVPVIDFPTSTYLPQYVSFFVVGVVAYRRDWLAGITTRMGRVGLGLAIGATVVFLPLALGVGSDWAGHGTLASLFYALWDSSFAVGLVLALVALFRRRFNTSGPVRRYLSGQAFTVYVIHAMVVTAAGHALSSLDVPTMVKFTIAAVVVLPVCFLLAGLVRRLPGVRRVL